MQDGDKLKLRGPAGALFVVTVGQPFTKELIEARIARGEWSYPNGEAPAPQKAKAKPAAKPEPEKAPTPAREPDPDRPAANAPKSEWVVYVARTQHMSREDAANYTKADLIDMVS
ncbi:hypothetical protein [Streptomyces ardesiacus]|uniref:Uncharacterized protein n=1 Tax=Streptomyces ardesiacus TaxID=285564 RepID=A0ABW8H715_9ACTN